MALFQPHFVSATGGGTGQTAASPQTIVQALAEWNNVANPLNGHQEMYVISNVSVTANLTVTRSSSNVNRLVWAGRSSDGLSDQNRTITSTNASGTAVVFTYNGSHPAAVFRNLTFDVTGAVGKGIFAAGSGMGLSLYRCTTIGGGGTQGIVPAVFTNPCVCRCEFINSVGSLGQTSGLNLDLSGSAIIESSAHGSTAAQASYVIQSWIAYRCAAYANIGAGANICGHGFRSIVAVSCVAHNNDRSGFDAEGGGTNCTVLWVDCLSHAHTDVSQSAHGGGYYLDVAGDGSQNCAHLLRCGSQGNTNGRLIYDTNTFAFDDADPSVTADPFVNAAGGDFALNDTAGGGLACKETTGLTLPQNPATVLLSYHDRGQIQKAGTTQPGTTTNAFTGQNVNRGVNN